MNKRTVTIAAMVLLLGACGPLEAPEQGSGARGKAEGMSAGDGYELNFYELVDDGLYLAADKEKVEQMAAIAPSEKDTVVGRPCKTDDRRAFALPENDCRKDVNPGWAFVVAVNLLKRGRPVAFTNPLEPTEVAVLAGIADAKIEKRTPSNIDLRATCRGFVETHWGEVDEQDLRDHCPADPGSYPEINEHAQSLRYVDLMIEARVSASSDFYRYPVGLVLELDGSDEIIGGEWIHLTNVADTLRLPASMMPEEAAQ